MLMSVPTHTKALDLAYIALMAALIALCAWISVPLGPVPFTMQTFGIFAALGLLGGRRGTLAFLIYLLLGIVGLPVFSGFSAGAGVLFGATGGYLLGYLAAALFIVTMSGLGVAIANRSDTMQQTMFVMFFFVMIFVLMSGLITPIASMPGWAQAITRLLPPRYFIGIMRAVYLKGTALGELWGDYAALAGFALVFGMSAILTCRKRT